MSHPVALEFAKHVIKDQPPDAEFTTVYDAMSRAAAGRQFRKMGLRELRQVGVSFSLLAMGELESLVAEAR